MKQKSIACLLALLLCLGLCSPAAASGFADVTGDAYYAEAVDWAADHGITSGTTETTFLPNKPCTEEEVLTFIHRYMGSPAAGSSQNADVSGSFYAQAVAWAREQGIASSSVFHGDTPCTRSSAIEYLWKLAGSPAAGGSGFTDVPADASYAPAVSWAVENGITSGTSQTAFSPEDICSRGQIVTFLYRFDALDAATVDTRDSGLAARCMELEDLIAEARRQFEEDDHTPLAEPVSYRILWLGYTHVTYDKLDFRMTDFDKEYLQAVTLNFEKVVEKYSGHNIDVTVDLHFIDETMPLTKGQDANWLYLARETVQSDVDTYSEQAYYDTVLTTVQTKGNENEARNRNRPGYGTYDVMLGLEFYGLESTMGYSTFNLYEPKDGNDSLQDPEVPSLYATGVALHEWLHQLEYLGELLGVEYPNTHAYQGPELYPGYEAVAADASDDEKLCAFYEAVLGGIVPFADENGAVRNVGMYPGMWQLVKRDVLNMGNFTIKNSADGSYLIGQEEEPTVTTSSQAAVWNVRYGAGGACILTPEAIPSKQLTLSNAWDLEDNPLHMFIPNPGYLEAQLWRLSENADGTYCIRTAYSSGRAVTVEESGAPAVIQSTEEPEENQKWIFTRVN